MTKIPWTEVSINPWIGCTKIAAGCKNCYAERQAAWLRGMGNKNYAKVLDGNKWNNRIVFQMEQLDMLIKMRRPRMVFIGSMSDPFHEDVSESNIYKVLMVTQQANWHTYQILTKRIERAADVLNKFYGTSDGVKWPFENTWLGTSISTQADADKNIPILLQIPAAVRFVSLEPMLERVDLRTWTEDWHCPKCRGTGVVGFGSGSKRCPMFCHLSWKKGREFFTSGFHQIIIGCESGPGARLCSIEDIRDAVRQCREANVPVFVKQVPINGKCSKKPEEWPEDLRIQEYPK